MLKINDLTQLSQNNVKTLFNEEVENFFIKNKISFMSDIVLIGKSRLQNNFDFGIGRSENAPQRIIRVINNADLNQIRNVMFSWEDIREVRGDMQLITIINDLVKVPTSDNITALEQYDIKTVFWSKREDGIKLLGAQNFIELFQNFDTINSGRNLSNSDNSENKKKVGFIPTFFYCFLKYFI